MKTSIANLLMHNAVDHVKRSLAAEKKRQKYEEICHSIAAHLMAALVLEGIGNEVSEVAFSTWAWKRIEKMDTALKWYILSGLHGSKQFDPSKEPLRTVQHLQKIRNRIAHPKIMDRGKEIIIISKDGKLHRNVSMDKKLKDGDAVLLGYGKLLNEFNANSAKQVVEKTIEALKCLREHLRISGLEWIENFEKKVSGVTK
jgi:hypothetical protein